jgi:hypothetical protein
MSYSTNIVQNPVSVSSSYNCPPRYCSAFLDLVVLFYSTEFSLSILFVKCSTIEDVSSSRDVTLQYKLCCPKDKTGEDDDGDEETTTGLRIW